MNDKDRLELKEQIKAIIKKANRSIKAAKRLVDNKNH